MQTPGGAPNQPHEIGPVWTIPKPSTQAVGGFGMSVVGEVRQTLVSPVGEPVPRPLGMKPLLAIRLIPGIHARLTAVEGEGSRTCQEGRVIALSGHLVRLGGTRGAGRIRLGLMYGQGAPTLRARPVGEP